MAFLPILSAIVGMAGTVMSAAGAMQQANAQAAAAEYNAKVADNNAKAERDAAAANAEDQRRHGSAQRATSLATRGASGVQLAGTPLLIDSNLVGEIELGAGRIGQQGEAKAIRYQNQAELDRSTAKNYKKSGSLSAGASLLGGLSRIF